MANKFSEKTKKKIAKVGKKAARRTITPPPRQPPASLNLSTKKTNAWMTANRSEIAGHAEVKKNPPKISVGKSMLDWVSGKVVPKAAKSKKEEIADML